MDLPRAFQNPGQWCWFNALLQALAAINDPRWWRILSSDGETKDVLFFLASVLRYINRRGEDPNVAELALTIQQECGMSSVYGEQQDAHEALVKLLEALDLCLSRRQLDAFLAFRWQPRLGSPHLLRWCAATQALRDFQELFEGVLAETRTCTTCGLVRVESCPKKQAFRCLSLDLINVERPHLSSLNLLQLLQSAYGGATEELQGLVCSRCSLEASLRHYVSSGSACGLRRFGGLEAVDVEAMQVLRPAWAPPLVLQRRTHLRSYRIRVPPRILSFHLRRLIFGPFGFMKVSNPVRYSELLKSEVLPGCYALCSVMSHLGQATAGHFITHRVCYGDERVPRAVQGKVQPWFPTDGVRLIRGDSVQGFGRQGTLGRAGKTSKLWACANDEEVIQVPAWQATNLSAAYIFFYERCASD